MIKIKSNQDNIETRLKITMIANWNKNIFQSKNREKFRISLSESYNITIN